MRIMCTNKTLCNGDVHQSHLKQGKPETYNISNNIGIKSEVQKAAVKCIYLFYRMFLLRFYFA